MTLEMYSSAALKFNASDLSVLYTYVLAPAQSTKIVLQGPPVTQILATWPILDIPYDGGHFR